MAQQPALDRRSLMRAVVIHDQVYFQILRHLGIDIIEEFPEFSGAMSAKTFAHYISRRYVQRGKK
jgi:hypothetical protein